MIKGNEIGCEVSPLYRDNLIYVLGEALTAFRCGKAIFDKATAAIKSENAAAFKSKDAQTHWITTQALRTQAFVADFAAGKTTTPIIEVYTVIEQVSDEVQRLIETAVSVALAAAARAA